VKYLVTGKNGQLARAFIRRFEEKSIDFHAPDESRLDITDVKAVADVVGSYKPEIIINCAAYNLVDKAEQDKDAAFAVNAIGPQNIAQAAAKQKALLVHFGSDYVFDGLKEDGLYVESDPINPVNVYGKSKLAGEQHVIKELDRYLIFRLSWVFGEGKQNFIYKLSSWAANNEYLKIACDEFSVPTHTKTVVDATLKALEKGITGLYHLTNTGFCSRYEWAKLILSSLGVNKFIRPVTMDAFELPAKRPKFSAMNNKKITSFLNIDIPAWEDAVKSFLHDGKGKHEQ
jgi:dTDP-4-dehydrorhamnose reductase